MPTARSPSTCWTASVTIPAGFVKLISHAFGACCAIVSASRTITGIVRSAKQMPPGPVVSWPSTPSPSGTSSSTTRPSSWPTRIAENTKSAPSTASTRSVVARNGSRVPCSAASPSSTGPIRSSRVASMSCSTTSSRLSRPAFSSSAPYTSGTRKPPPPTIVSFMRSSPRSRRRRRSSGRRRAAARRSRRGRSTPARTRARRRSSRTSPRRRSARRDRRRRSSAA